MTPSRREAVRTLVAGSSRIERLLVRLPPKARSTPGLGGGTWSAKDLVGHIASWEENALDALAAWERGEPAPVDVAFRSASMNQLNASWVEARASWSWSRVHRHEGRVNEMLLEAIRSLSDDRWYERATPRSKKSVGDRLGGILGGPGGPFTHADAHLPDLRALVASTTRAAQRPGRVS